MDVVRHSCILLCHHAILPESYTKGTILMSRPQRDTNSFHEQAGKLGEIGSEGNRIVIFVCSVSVKELTGEEREHASPGRGPAAHSLLVQCSGSGEI